MEPNDDAELTRLLREWSAPPIPGSLERRIVRGRPCSWTRLPRGTIRVPLPVAWCAAAFVILSAWQWVEKAPEVMAPSVMVRTRVLEVPVVRDRVVTKVIYVDRRGRAVSRHGVTSLKEGFTFDELRPVAELRPRIIRGEHGHEN